ncbi:betaine-aldehyde dehydrogenase (plasmid) [Rhodococcus erythropolis R138]|uniref:aldehyde dehydrogenase family protein n=1 Tax=Rhodococcus erythropolis TaxID=1833 RepID=UPI00068B05D5|nr:aldehyde dehydrogenase family protein [Rhodococcus erythropolis]ALU73667.1 betaine-aldehyde dehydrogenase [Rhodococcus erythropolis R138]
MREYKNYINGKFVDGKGAFAAIDPATGRPAAWVHEADATVVDLAVDSARGSFDASWRTMPVDDRCAVMRSVADMIECRSDDLVDAEVADTGQPERRIRDFDIVTAAEYFRDCAQEIVSERDAASVSRGAGRTRDSHYSVRRPLGVIGMDVPWSLPLLSLVWRLAPALASGNAVVAKPSEETPGTATVMAEIVESAGVPPGVFNVVHGFGLGSAAEILSAHPKLDGALFSPAIDKKTNSRVNRFSSESGGNNAAIVFSDVNLESTAESIARSVFFNTGQHDLCIGTVFVERPIYAEMCELLVARAHQLSSGSPTSSHSDFGPAISRAQQDRVLQSHVRAERSGAIRLTSAESWSVPREFSDGFWVEPTIWALPNESAQGTQQPIFGPSATILPFDNDDEVIERANRTVVGLAASVWTADLTRGHRVAQKMDSEIVWLNSWFARHPRPTSHRTTMQGPRQATLRQALDIYTDTTNIVAAKHN